MSIPTTKVCLQFSTLHLLWKFAQGIDCKTVEINTAKRTLTCNCSEKEMELAKNEYSAVLFQERLFSNQ